MAESRISVLQTSRLSLELMTLDDAPFVLGLVNEAPFIRFIGDKGVRCLDDAERYIRDVPLADYADHEYGGYLVRRRDTGTPVGICGLYKRPDLDDPDLGFALAEACCGRGYAREAAAGVIRFARDRLSLRWLVALVDPDNERSLRLVEGLGFLRDGTYRMPGETSDLIRLRLCIDTPPPRVSAVGAGHNLLLEDNGV